MSHYANIAKEVFAFLNPLGEKAPEAVKGFMGLHQGALAPGKLSTKEKELIAVGIAISARCEGCISIHVKAALDSGATEDEILETIGVAILMGGGPSLVYGQRAYDAFKEYSR